MSQTVNADFLRGKMLAHLFAAQPSRVLDVGCGRGQLLELCRGAGLAAVGLEGSAKRAQELAMPVVRGSATALPFADNSFEWSIMRHVAHHLDDPERAMHELARVASKGVLVAEPWRPADIPACDTARSIDEWCKAHHRRQGMVHDTDIPGEQLATWLRGADNFELQIEYVSQPVNVEPAEIIDGIRSAIADLPDDHAEQAHATAWIELIAKTGFSATGSAIVIARKH